MPYRDEHDFSVQHSLTEYQNGVVNGTSPWLTTRKSKLSRRSVAVGTPRLPDGSYGHPTDYEAFFGLTSTSSGSQEWVEYVWMTRNGRFDLYPNYYLREWTGQSDYGYISYGCFNMTPSPSGAAVSRARNNAIEKIRHNDLDLGVNLGELRESVSTVTSILRDVAKLVGRIPIGLSPRRLAAEWLRYQYGIKPLMSDAYAALEVIQNGLGDPEVAKVKSVAMDDDFSLPKNTTTRKFSGSVKRGVEVGYTLVVTNATAFQLWRYGLTNPLSLAWELTTLSFVVDWFLHVGDFLSGLVPPLGLRVVEGYQTNFLENHLVVEEMMSPNHKTRTSFVNYGSKVPDDVWGSCTCNTTAMQRFKLSAVVGSVPYLDLDLNLSQALSALALIATRRP